MDSCLKDRHSSTMSGKAREVRLGLGNAFMTLRKEPSEDNAPSDGTMRQKVHSWLDHILSHTVIVLLVLLDVLILVFLVLIDQNIIQAPPKSNTLQHSSSTTIDSSVRKAESILHIINIVILLFFLLEITCRVVAEGAPILKDKFQIFDCIIVITTFILYIILTAAKVDRTVTYSIGFIITLRLWRVRRIYSGVKSRERRQAERIINVHRKAREQAEEQVKNLEVQLRLRQEEIGILQRRLNAVQGSNMSLAANSINSVDVLSSVYDKPRHDFSNPQRKSWSEGLDKVANEHYGAKLSNGSLPGYTQLASPTFGGKLDKYHSHGPVYGSIQNASIVGNCAEKVQNYKQLSASSLSQDLNGLGTVYNSTSPDFQKTGHLDYNVYDGPQTIAYNDQLQGHCLSNSVPSTPVLNGVITDRGLTNGIPTPKDCSADPTVDILPKLASDSVMAGHNGTLNGDTPPNYSHYQLHPTANGYPSNGHGGDKQHLLRDGHGERVKTAYMNPGFDESSSSLVAITPEEEMEIRRISQVPFDSVDDLTEEGVIPMTDL